MHGLEVPDRLPGCRIERDHRIAVEIRSGAVAAEEVGARRGHRQEQPAAREVGGDRRPHVAAPARVVPVSQVSVRARPRAVSGGTSSERARAHVEPAHVAGRRVGAQRVGDRRAHRDHVAHDRTRRGDVVLARVVEGAIPSRRFTDPLAPKSAPAARWPRRVRSAARRASRGTRARRMHRPRADRDRASRRRRG